MRPRTLELAVDVAWQYLLRRVYSMHSWLQTWLLNHARNTIWYLFSTELTEVCIVSNVYIYIYIYIFYACVHRHRCVEKLVRISLQYYWHTSMNPNVEPKILPDGETHESAIVSFECIKERRALLIIHGSWRVSYLYRIMHGVLSFSLCIIHTSVIALRFHVQSSRDSVLYGNV